MCKVGYSVYSCSSPNVQSVKKVVYLYCLIHVCEPKVVYSTDDVYHVYNDYIHSIGHIGLYIYSVYSKKDTTNRSLFGIVCILSYILYIV